MKCAAIFLTGTLSLVGCSTITQSETQALSLTATYKNEPVEADCELRNDKGSWHAKSPAHVTVRKSNEDLEVRCEKEGMPAGLLKAISRAAGSMFGNIIFGGGIGAIIDHAEGTGYDYPNRLPVKMGEAVIVDRKTELEAQQSENANGDGMGGQPSAGDMPADKQKPTEPEPKPSAPDGENPSSTTPDNPPQ